MQTVSKATKRSKGVYYTPINLAQYLVSNITRKNATEVLDPACGDGALLRAAVAKFGSNLNCIGCDIRDSFDVKGFRKVKFFEKDFLALTDRILTSLIVLNPPYVRYDRINSEQKRGWVKWLKSHHSVEISGRPDLWIFFMFKVLGHLKDGGSVAAILPKAFLQSDYALVLRKYLREHFERIRFLSLGKSYFPDAKERVVLLWLDGYNKPNAEIVGSYSEEFNTDVVCYPVGSDLWDYANLSSDCVDYANTIINSYKSKYGFIEFSSNARCLIGIVTGMNKYFVKSSEEALQLGFNKTDVLPVMTKGSDLASLTVTRTMSKKCLLIQFPNRKKIKNYLKLGKRVGAQKSSHAKGRTPWYSVKQGQLPHAFFPYRSSAIPFLTLAEGRVQSLNSIHRIYFNTNINAEAKKWIQLSLLSNIGQLSIELHSKIYGRGLLKAEPGDLKKALVYRGKGRVSQSVYARVNTLLKKKSFKKASQVATEYINSKVAVKPALSQRATELLELLQRRRMGDAKYEILK